MKKNIRTNALPCVGFLFLLGACTALETSPAPNANFDQKAHVGQYYLLPKALVNLQGAPDADNNYLVTTSVNLVPDRRYKYFLNWRPNAFSEDIISNLEVGTDGLLSTVNYSAEDKTPVIVGDIITTGINLFKIAGNLGLTRAEKGAAPPKRPPFNYTFDPFDAHETTRVRDALLKNQQIALWVSPDPTKTMRLQRAADPETGGVFYHPPTTIELLLVDESTPARSQPQESPPESSGKRVDKKKPAPAGSPPATAGASPAASPATGGKKDGSKGDESGAADNGDGNAAAKKPAAADAGPVTRCRVVMTVPDLDRVVCFRLGRSFMTKREANLTFSHGMPGKLVFKQPSAVQAVTGTLSAVTSTVATAVPTLIKISDDRKIAALQEQSALATEQSKLLEAQKKVIDDQNALAKAKAGLPQATNRSDDADMQKLRDQIDQQQKNITSMKQGIKRKLESSDLTTEEKDKALKAAGLDQDEP